MAFLQQLGIVTEDILTCHTRKSTVPAMTQIVCCEKGLPYLHGAYYVPFFIDVLLSFVEGVDRYGFFIPIISNQGD